MRSRASDHSVSGFVDTEVTIFIRIKQAGEGQFIRIKLFSQEEKAKTVELRILLRNIVVTY